MNSWMHSVRDSRTPIEALVEGIRIVSKKWMDDRRACQKWREPLPPRVQGKVVEGKVRCRQFQSAPNGIVNASCTCGWQKLNGFCGHVVQHGNGGAHEYLYV